MTQTQQYDYMRQVLKWEHVKKIKRRGKKKERKCKKVERISERE